MSKIMLQMQLPTTQTIVPMTAPRIVPSRAPHRRGGEPCRAYSLEAQETRSQVAFMLVTCRDRLRRCVTAVIGSKPHVPLVQALAKKQGKEQWGASVWDDIGGRGPTYPYSSLQQNLTADVVVVGGGIAGLTTAYNLVKAGECRDPR